MQVFSMSWGWSEADQCRIDPQVKVRTKHQTICIAHFPFLLFFTYLIDNDRQRHSR